MSTIAAGRSPRVRLARPGEGLLADFLVVLLAWTTASAVAGSHWVPGSEAVIPVAIVGAISVAALARVAPRGVTYWLVIEVAMVLVLFLSTAHHSGDPGDIATDFRTWVLAIARDLNTALVVTMVAGTWLGVAWAGYWVLRRGQAPLGLGPMAVVLGVEVVDDPSQSAITFLVVAWMVMAGLLLLRHTVIRVEHRWGAATAPGLSSSVGIQGSRALVVMLVAASLIPRLNATDISPRFFSGSIGAVGGGQLPLARPGPGGSFAATGYSEKVQPGGALSRSLTPVMEVTTNFPRTTYLRGIDLYADSNGAWAPGSWVDNLANVPPNQMLAEDLYLARHTVHATIKILGSGQNTIFWPGEPLFASIPAQVRGARPTGSLATSLPVGSVAGAYARGQGGTGATYTVDATVSVATEAELRGAGTNYPASVTDLVPGLGQLAGPSAVDDRITALATQVVAGQTTPYDQVKAIETYLRTKLKYNLQVSTPPSGQDPVIYFLFNSHVGYCEYFASAMGELVRGLGIPVRLVSGYGPGVSEALQDVPRPRASGTPTTSNLVRAFDAHTWVEVFFPSYGWVPFEPTPDPIYPTLSQQAFDPAIDTFPAVVAPTAVPPPALQSRRPAATPVLGKLVTAFVAGAVGLLVLLALVGLLLARGPRRLRNPEVAWRRLGWLAARLGRPRRPTDTPIEFAQQLAASLPGVASEISDLGGAYSQWCYRPNGIVGADRHRADDAWRKVRRVMVRELLWPRRARPAT
jgi:transglutaminase-like putative cysteine protease